MMRVLVTGGAGYIGSHVAKALAQAGFEPVVLDNFSTGHRWAVRWGPFVESDLADIDVVWQTLETYRVGAAIHLAASAYVGESMKNPRKYFHNNVVNSLNLLDALLDAGVKRVVFSSSCQVYGDPDILPIPEEHPLRPVNPYGESKHCVEQILRWYGEAYGLRSVALRYFNAAGADVEGTLGEEHDPETHLVPSAIQTALGKRPFMTVNGTDYSTSDGTAVRDYVHVTDLARAHVLAMQYLVDNGTSVALNLGGENNYSVLAVVRAVERVTGMRVPLQHAPRRPGDLPVLFADSTRAKQLFSWQPQHSNIETIVETAWRWHTRQ